jgi:hypothetical protein
MKKKKWVNGLYWSGRKPLPEKRSAAELAEIRKFIAGLINKTRRKRGKSG